MPLVAVGATSWDAALPAGRAGAERTATLVGVVHSVHDRVVNLRIGDGLIALADDVLDDAPHTVRVPFHGLPPLRQGAGIRIDADGILLDAEGCRLLVRWDGDRGWAPLPASDDPVLAEAVTAARAVLEAHRGLPPQTDLGRASAALLDTGIAELRRAAALLLSAAHTVGSSDTAPPDTAGSPDIVASRVEAGVEAAARRLVGLGEGLTPSGDDILTGLAFLSARPSLRLGALRTPLRGVIGEAAAATTLLSVTTMRAAVEGRARARLHDLADAIDTGDLRTVDEAAAAVLSIGHSSGADILTGIRLALDLALLRSDGARHSPEQHAPHQKENPA